MLRVWLIFLAVLMVLIALLTPAVEGDLCRWTASLTAAVLRMLGENAETNGIMMRSSLYNFQIIPECTAVYYVILLVSGVVAMPRTVLSRVCGVVIAVVSILLVNAFRLVSLTYVGHSFPAAFDTIHMMVWQPLMWVCALLFWVVWVTRSE